MNQKGFTLIEFIVAFSLFSIIIAIASGSFIQIIRSYRVAAALTTANDSMALTIEQISREMRTGYNFCVIADSPPQEPKIQFVNANNEVVRYKLDFIGKAIMRAASNVFNSVNGNYCLDVGDSWFNYEKMTANSVAVSRLNIIACGNNINSDIVLDNCGGLTTRPRITLTFSITGAEPEIERLGIFIDAQTTISARNIAKLPAP